jgi:hypothetical protein
MKEITREQIVSMIEANANDFWTIAETNHERFNAFRKDKVDLDPEQFVNICITQFIQLKSNRNFGSVPVHSKEDKKEVPKDKPNPDDKQGKFHIKDPEADMTPGQKAGIEKLMNIPGAFKIINTFRDTHGIDGGWETANKGQASEIMDLLVKLAEEKKEGK